MLTGDILDSLIDKVRLRRLEANLSQKQVADRAGISRRSYQDFEKTGRVSLGGFVRILNALGRSGELRELLNTKTDFESLDDFVKQEKPLRKRARPTQ